PASPDTLRAGPGWPGFAGHDPAPAAPGFLLPLPSSGRRRREALGFDAAVFEQVAFHLLLQILARGRVGQVEAVFAGQARLVLLPFFPGFLGHALPDAGAEFAGVRGEVEPFGFALQFYAVDGTGHGLLPIISDRQAILAAWRIWCAGGPAGGPPARYSFLMKTRLLRERL